jgi:hypothetical protein
MARRPVTPVVSTKTAEEENMDLFMEEMLGDMSPDPEPAPAPAPALDLSALLDPPSASLTFEDAAPLPPSDPPPEPDAEPMTEGVLVPTSVDVFVDMTEEELIASVDGYLSLPDNVKSEMAAGRRRNWETDLAKYMAAS